MARIVRAAVFKSAIFAHAGGNPHGANISSRILQSEHRERQNPWLNFSMLEKAGCSAKNQEQSASKHRNKPSLKRYSCSYFRLVGVEAKGDERGDDVGEPIEGFSMSCMLNLEDIFHLSKEGFNQASFSQQDFILQQG